jgi:hypothetical protein
MREFLIEAPHTKEECLKTLDMLEGKGQEMLSRFEFGCESGEHVAWATVQANDERDLSRMMPREVMQRAKIHPVTRFSREKIQELHNM